VNVLDADEFAVPRFVTARDFVLWQMEQPGCRWNSDVPLVYPSDFHFLAQHGEEFRPRELPPALSRGENRKCFTNVAAIVAEDPARYSYVEGQAGMPGGSAFEWMRHAWLTDGEGAALDVTWPWHAPNAAWPSASKASYFGVSLPFDVVQAILPGRGGSGVLEKDDLLRKPFDR
jgi:hypothetical protein